MALTSAGRQLTRAHRFGQLQIRAAAAADTLTIWAAGFDPADINGSWTALEPAVLAVTNDYRSQSSNLAAAYYQTHRQAEGVPGRAEPRLAVPPSREVMRHSLSFYGRAVPHRLLQAGAQDVSARAAVQLLGGVGRHVANGGRETIGASTLADRQAVGMARITVGTPCAFCAMLASRGPVYKSPETAAGGRWSGADQAFKVHDHCACTVEPVYQRGEWAEQWPEAAQYRDLWNQAQSEASAAGELHRGTSNDALNAFRRLLSAN